MCAGTEGNQHQWDDATEPDGNPNQKSKIDIPQIEGTYAILPAKVPLRVEPHRACLGSTQAVHKAYSKYIIHSLCVNMPLRLDSVTVDNIRNHMYFRKARQYIFAYLGVTVGSELKSQVKM